MKMMDLNERQNKAEPRIIINGAGLTGCTLALYLAQKGHKVKVFEKRDNNRSAFESKRRTVSMSLSVRGIQTLKDLGIYDNYNSTLAPVYGRAVHLKDGNNYYQEYGKNKEVVYTINRKDYNNYLIDKCIETGLVTFYFNHSLDAINFTAKNILFNAGSKTKVKENYDYLFGADGVFSPVRTQLQRQNLVGSYLEDMGLYFKEIFIPPVNDEYPLNPDYCHFWNAADILFAAFPNGRKGFSGTMFYPKNGVFSNIKDKNALIKFVEENCHFVDCVGKDFFFKQFSENPVSEIFANECEQWNYQDSVLLLGDACHAMPPFYGMGMNTCMETVRLFSKLIDTENGDISQAILKYTDLRKPDTECMVKMAKINYHNLRASSSVDFDLKWKKEQENMLMNENYESEYFKIAFSSQQFRNIIQEKYKNIPVSI
jgi:kynurenine 3-monooxygenase